MDQLLLKSAEVEDVLALLVTHRGVFFVHNLVTAIQVLAALSETAQNTMELNATLQDPRYDLLVRDLLRFVPKLDFLAMANVASSLQAMDHRHYMLLSRMLRPLVHQYPPDTATLLRCIQAYNWAGYHAQDEFYNHFSTALAERAQVLSASEIAEVCSLFGKATRYQGRLFQAMEEAILENNVLEDMTPQEVGIVATAFSAHLRTCHDALFERVAALMEEKAGDMEVVDIARCFRAFRRVALRFEPAILAGLEASAGPLHEAWLLRRPAHGVQLADVATLLECAAFYGVHCNITQVGLDYLDEHVDEVAEQSAIHTVFAMCLNGGVNTHSNLLLYLFRKIGAGTAWEAHKVRVFQLWFSQQLQFPWLDSRLRRRCVASGLRAWCLLRRGYGCPFPDEVKEISAELEAMGISQRTFVPIPDTPYEVDVAIGAGKDGLLVTTEVSRNTNEPVGGALMQLHHLKARGWRCLVVPRAVWRGLPATGAAGGGRRQYLEGLLQALAT